VLVSHIGSDEGNLNGIHWSAMLVRTAGRATLRQPQFSIGGTWRRTVEDGQEGALIVCFVGIAFGKREM
jgi:hypothetical protein